MKASGISVLLKALFYHLVGATEQRQRDRDAKRLGGLEVDDQLDLGGLLDRQVGGLFALEHAPGVDADLTIRVDLIAAVADETASGREVGKLKNAGHRMAD